MHATGITIGRIAIVTEFTHLQSTIATDRRLCAATLDTLSIGRTVCNGIACSTHTIAAHTTIALRCSTASLTVPALAAVATGVAINIVAIVARFTGINTAVAGEIGAHAAHTEAIGTLGSIGASGTDTIGAEPTSALFGSTAGLTKTKASIGGAGIGIDHISIVTRFSRINCSVVEGGKTIAVR
jgi:hypothetical protein